MTNQAKRELTLEEWVGGLPEGHRARVELAALKEYATHKPGCYENSNACICGLDALLEEQCDDLEDG